MTPDTAPRQSGALHIKLDHPPLSITRSHEYPCQRAGVGPANPPDASTGKPVDHPDVKVVALSIHTDGKIVRSMLEAGAHGYVTKETSTRELCRAIRKVRDGLKYLSSDVTTSVVEGYLSHVVPDQSAMTRLAGREREVLQFIAEGLNSGEIAGRLNISTNTVDTHRRNLMKKLNLHSIAALTKYAIREGLTDVNR